FQERLSHRRDEVGESDPAIDVRLAFARPGRDAGNGVGGLSEFEQCPESQGFLQGMNVFPLKILSHLGFDGLRVREFDDADGKVFEFRDAGGPQTTRSGYDFVFAFLQFAHQQGRENALCFETRGLLCRWRFCGREPQMAHGNWWCPRRRTHNDYSELSHFSSSSSLRQPSLRRNGTEVATGGRQAATAAIFPLRVISA